MLELRAAAARGNANFGWLNSQHSFSFGRYYDPAQMGFSALRVINDDRVAPGGGFDTHGHQNMEIISLVLSGTMAHRDSTGQQQLLPAGEFQLMSAGRGITHSEYNAHADQPLHFLQIWIQPNVQMTEPGYQQKAFATKAGLQLIASADGRDDSLLLKQDAALYQLQLASGQQELLDITSPRQAYLHLIDGELTVQSTLDPMQSVQLQAGDGLKIADLTQLTLMATITARALIFDLP